METLSAKQKILLEDLKDDILLYKEELGGQIYTHKLGIVIGAIVAVIFCGILVFYPEFITKLQTVSEHMGLITGFVGEVLPVAYITKSANSSKAQSKKLKGLRLFEKNIQRMEYSIIPNDEDDIIALEMDLSIYVTT